ncbi:hypothetical protein NECAME_16872 [Necator americanus]|uniref:Uncharacterized protein n=1 Tax=Necator americanus TaxID=51031 RepID=W2TVV3_NECAM|nr:hypothetical protein NECAME_16872 [Necator americanus]ETN85191.1 hypothetical protein NECAME_16872 [Necator americanus]
MARKHLYLGPLSPTIQQKTCPSPDCPFTQRCVSVLRIHIGDEIALLCFAFLAPAIRCLR